MSNFPDVRRPVLCYEGHVENVGWQGPVFEGKIAGCPGKNLKLEALRLWYQGPGSIITEVHVENLGWLPGVSTGALAGTTGRNFRIEALKCQIVNCPGVHIEYQGFVQKKGWTQWVKDGEVCGTSGEALRLEGIRFRLSFDN
ncbi:hypothetical protein WA158_002474 [Blastocystis sp. Blastoise]